MADQAQPEISAGTAVSGNAARAFISYASQDKVVADAVCQALEHAGVTCWIAPRDVVLGGSYAGEIVHAIDATKLLILILSKNSADSKHVIREVERASSKGHSVVGFKIDMAPISADLEYFLNTSQWLDASDTGVERALPRLIDAVKRVISSLSTAGNFQGSTASASQRAPVSKVGNRRLRFLALALGALVALGSVYFAVDKLWFSKRSAPEQPATAATTGVSEKSIAVLPFVDMSEKKDQEYFADGMAEEVLDLLAKTPGLHIPARTSSFYFKGKSEDIPTIARHLMVANVLEGSVRKSGNRVRVTVQLVRADNGYHLWSETYDRTVDDIFKVQDEIAGEVVRALKISLGTNAAPRIVPTNNAEAHSLLLQAQFWIYRGTKDDYRKAASYYQQAIHTDPDFAAAWAGLSEALLFGEILSAGQNRQQVHESALRAAERAVALDPKLAEAHRALGEVRYWADWDWAAANTEYEMALSLDPGNSEALNGAGLLAAAHGHPADALRLCEQAAARDPLNYVAYWNLSDIYYAMGRFKEALAAARKSVELAPTAAGAHLSPAQMLLAVGQNDDALAEVEKESDAGFRAYGLARTYILLGRRGDADAALAEVEKTFSAEQPYNIATLHALRGDRDQAFSWLERAYQQHDGIIIGMPPITVDPDMKNLHGDPRWKAFLRKMNLP